MKWGFVSNALPERNTVGKFCRWGDIKRCSDKKKDMRQAEEEIEGWGQMRNRRERKT